MPKRLSKLLREPLVHFLLLSAGIYVLYGWLGEEDSGEDEYKITVSSADIQALSDQWTRLWQRPPTEEELRGVVRDWVRTRVLYQEAIAMGLDQGDIVIERRLAQKLELLAKGLITPEEPSDEELLAWYENNKADFTDPDLYTITQAFFDPDQRGETTLDDAAAALEALQAMDGVPDDMTPYGDRFLMLQGYYPSRTELEIRKAFGTGFTDQVIVLEPGQWHGPILSGYGTHLVYVHEVIRATSPDFEVVRDTVREVWTAEQVEQLSERFIEDIVARYDIEVEETAVPLTVPRQDASQP